MRRSRHRTQAMNLSGCGIGMVLLTADPQDVRKLPSGEQAVVTFPGCMGEAAEGRTPILNGNYPSSVNSE